MTSTITIDIDVYQRVDGAWVGAWRFPGRTWESTIGDRCAVHSDREAAVMLAVRAAVVQAADENSGSVDAEFAFPNLAPTDRNLEIIKSSAAQLAQILGWDCNVPAEPATEPTEAGLQYVVPGCEKDRSRGPVQMDLF